MPRPRIERFSCPRDPRLESGLNAIIAELNRLGQMDADGQIGFSNGEDGPKFWLHGITNNAGLILCRITSAGLTARQADVPTAGIDTLGTGTVKRYLTDGETIILSATSEPATSSYWVAIDGDSDGWFSDLGGTLSLVTRHCLDAPPA